MERQAIRQRLQLQQEFQQIERSRLGMQIRSMEHLWLLPALPALAASSVSAISAGDGNAPASTAHLLNQAAAVAPVYTHPPVVEQFEWQMRENYQLLTAYLNRRDEFGDFVPPPLRPHGLHSREIDSDLAFIRQAEFTLACEQQQQQPPPSPIVEAS
jgi:hypothetical protein